MKKLLVSGLDDPPGGKYRSIILDNVPATWVTFFMDSKNSLGVVNNVELVICCHPKLLKLIFGPEKQGDRWQGNVKGWWKVSKDAKTWIYSTTKHTLAHDIFDIVEHAPLQ